MTIETILRVIIAAVISYLLWVIIGWLAAAVGIPTIVVTLCGILIFLGFLAYVARIFGIYKV